MVLWAGLSPDDLLLLLSVIDEIDKELTGVPCFLADRGEALIELGGVPGAWCGYYETSYPEQVQRIVNELGLDDVLKEISGSKNQIKMAEKILKDFDAYEFTEEEAKELKSNILNILALSISLHNSLRALMVYGFYLNDMIADVRENGSAADKVLFNAVKIDPTVIGCPSVLTRMSKAVLEGDEKFLNALKRSINGKFTKREQSNYQKIRLILQVLHESGAARLGKEDLYKLFVEELNLIAGDRDTDSGDVSENLRQFSYQFMKQRSVSKKA